MNNPMYNAEGYPDPTACVALNNVTRDSHRRYRPLVYICSPLAGDIENNLQRARRFSRFALMQGAIPITPHLLFTQFMDEGNDEERRLGIFMGLVLLRKCRELWYFGPTISEGMELEIKKAREFGLPVRRFTEQCREVTPLE